MIGTKLAHYNIIGELGAGGMGEVWRAEDEKLGREVALKILPAEFAEDDQRFERFQREARVLARRCSGKTEGSRPRESATWRRRAHA